MLNLDYVTDFGYFASFSSTAILDFSIVDDTMKIIVLFCKTFPKRDIYLMCIAKLSHVFTEAN